VEGSCQQDDEPSGSVVILGNSRVAAQLAASEEGPGSVSKNKLSLHSKGSFTTVKQMRQNNNVLHTVQHR
jgi:hypothetical protein